MMLKVRQEGQGKKGNKKPVLFPKIVFLYDKDLHGKGCELEELFDAGVECSKKSMYPDWLSLTGEGYIASMYKNINVLFLQWVAEHSFLLGMKKVANTQQMK